MKIALFLVLMVLSIGYSNSQISRAFHQFEDYSNDFRCNLILSVNNQLVHFTSKESQPNNFRMTTTRISDLGETSDYYVIDFQSAVNGARFTLNGSAINSSNEAVIAFQAAQNASTTKIGYARVNALTGQIYETIVLPDTYRAAYVQSRQKGDSLITYASFNTSEFQRIAININGTFDYDVSAVGVNNSYGGGSGGNLGVDLLIVNNDEFIASNEVLYKRNSSGVYSSVAIPFSNQSSFYGINMCENDQGEIAVFANNLFALYANDLTPLNDGTITGISASNSKYNTVFYSNGKYVMYHDMTNSNINQKVIVNNSFQVENVYDTELSADRITYRATEIGGKIYVPGFITFQNVEHSLLIESNGILEDTKFIEYDQELFHEDLKVHTNHLGQQFTNHLNRSGFETLDDGEYKGLAFLGSKGIVGKDGTGSVVGFSKTYYIEEMQPGPFVIAANRTNELLDKYNRGYYVDKAMIEAHVLNYNTLGYIAPFGIREWPGNGNTSNGEPATILPFRDHNNNGIYEPELGDYPFIYGDKCVAKVFHQQDEANDVGIEWHEYMYAFDCDTSDLMKNTIFMTNHFFTRKGALTDAYIGSFLDSDIGGSQDDFAGTNVELGMVYGFNGDALDEGIGGQIGFGSNLPAIGMQILLGAKLADDTQDNAIGIGANQSVNGFGFQDTEVDNEYYTLESSRITNNQSVFPETDPLTNDQAYFVYQGKFQNGSNQQMNGVDSRYAYFGTSDPQFYASSGVDHGNNTSEVTLMNPQGDRRIYAGTGPVDVTMSFADTVKLVTAYIVAHDSINPSFDELTTLFNFGSQLKSQFAMNDAGCDNSFGFYHSDVNVGIEELKLNASVYPNPMNNKMVVSVKDNTINALKIVSLEGKEMYSNSSYHSTIEVDVSNLNSGMYVLIINTDKGVITKKITKL